MIVRLRTSETSQSSQIDILGWLEKLFEPLLDDTICNPSATMLTLIIGCKESMHRRNGTQDF